MLSGKVTNTNLIVFALTRPGLEPTIYNTRGKHSNHYTTDAVKNLIQQSLFYLLGKDKNEFFPFLIQDKIRQLYKCCLVAFTNKKNPKLNCLKKCSKRDNSIFISNKKVEKNQTKIRVSTEFASVPW